MAYVYDDDELDSDKSNQDSGKNLGTESGVLTADSTTQQNTDKGTGQYTNLQSYLDQNKQQDFGSQFSGKVGEEVDNADKAQTESETKFKSAADSGAVNEDEGLLNEATSSPETVVGDKNKLDSFRKMQTAQYGGPAQYSGSEEYYSPAKTATEAAVKDTQTAQTGEGQKALLDQYYGSGAQNYTYTPGQKNLDQILIGMNPNVRDQLQSQQQRAQGVQSKFSDLENQLNTYAKTKQSQTDKTRNDVASALGITANGTVAAPGSQGAIPQYEAQLQSQVDQAKAAQQAEIQKISGALTNRQLNNLSPEELQSLGIGQSDTLYNFGHNDGFDMSRYLNPTNNLNVATLSTPEQYAKLQAYMQLANQPNTLISDPSQVGQAVGKPSYDFDSSGLKNYLSTQQAKMNDELNNTYFDPTSSNANPFQNNGPNSYSANLNSVQDVLNRMAANNDAPELRYNQLQQVLNKINEIKQKYGAYDVGNAGSYSPKGQDPKRITKVRT